MIEIPEGMRKFYFGIIALLGGCAVLIIAMLKGFLTDPEMIVQATVTLVTTIGVGFFGANWLADHLTSKKVPPNPPEGGGK